MKRIASIDIGTNTVLLLIAETDGKTLRSLHSEQRIPRLGKQVDANRKLHPDSINRVLEALMEYRFIIDRHKVDDVVVTATSAVRDAANATAFVKQVKLETGFKVQVITGEMEALTTWNGALSVFSDANRPARATVIDIGGGSTEFVTGLASEAPEAAQSLDMGAVRYTERYFNAGFTPESIAEAETAALALLQNLAIAERFSGSTLTGVAGTVTSLASMMLDQKTFNPAPINGYTIALQEIETWFEKSVSLGTTGLIQAYPAVMKGRADVFPAGLLILKTAMKHLGFDALTVSCGGIREGAVLFRYLTRL
jgi:exopolyphosphatase/guanosine-5'-triphosphate,3'-diphosphate pyrophosphatase